MFGRGALESKLASLEDDLTIVMRSMMRIEGALTEIRDVLVEDEDGEEDWPEP